MKKKRRKKIICMAVLALMIVLLPVISQAGTWKKNSTGWWWQEDNGSYPVSQWKVINGKWYAFDERGYMRSGWFLSNGKWYYLGAANDGSMKTGWQLVNGSWYYMNPGNGDMAANQWIGNYYVGGSGAMLTDTWIGNYYVDGSGKWVPDAKKDQHTHKWVAETTVIHHDAVTKKELVKEAWDETIHHDEETKTVVDKEAWTETINHPAETHEELVKEAWDEEVTHPAETHQELVKEAWTEEIPHEEEGHYEATVPGHWEYKFVPAEGYEEEYETIDGATDKRFVVTKRAYTDSVWVEPKTVECNEIGYEVETPMYREEARLICGGCGLDITDDYKEGSTHDHLKEEAMKGNNNCSSSYSDYRMIQYDTRSVMYPATYVIDKEAWTESVQHEAEYKTVVVKEAWSETVHHDAEYKTVVDKEAWVETINHPAEIHEETVPARSKVIEKCTAKKCKYCPITKICFSIHESKIRMIFRKLNSKAKIKKQLDEIIKNCIHNKVDNKHTSRLFDIFL